MRAPRVAARQPSHGQPGTAEGSVRLECLDRIGRATRHMTTRRRSTCCCLLIDPHSPGQAARWQGRRDICHIGGVGCVHVDAPAFANTRTRWVRSSAELHPRADGCAITRYQPLGRGSTASSSDRIARIWRRSRFRCTAEPTRRPTAIATPAPAPSSGARSIATRVRGPERCRCAGGANRRKTARREIR